MKLLPSDAASRGAKRQRRDSHPALFAVMTVQSGLQAQTISGTFRSTSSRERAYANLRAKLRDEGFNPADWVVMYFYCEPDKGL